MDSPTKVEGESDATWRLAGVGVVLAASVLFLVRLGDRAVVSEESRWAEVAREMRQSGDFLRPTINGRTYFDKPVGSYWLIVAASYLTGEVDETAARLPAAVAGVVGVAVVILLGRRLYDDRTAVFAGAILATSFGYVFYARRATADLETVTGVLIAVWWFVRHEGRPGGPWVVGLWVWMAAVSLTKGLLGFALPIAVFLSYGAWTTWARRGERATVRSLAAALVTQNRWLFSPWTLVAVPVAIIGFLTPYLLAASHSGLEAGLEMVWRENVRRFFAPHNHVGPVYLYGGVIFVLAAPWSVFLPAAFLPSGPAATPGDRLARIYFWALFVFFTASASRRSYYLLPVLPAVSLLVGRVLAAPRQDLSVLVRRLRSVGWLALGITVVGAGVTLVPPTWLLLSPYDRLPPLPSRGGLAVGWLAGVIGVVIGVARPNASQMGIAFLIAFLAFVYGFGVAYPAADELRFRREFLNGVRDRTVLDPDRLSVYRANDIVFDYGQTIPQLTSSDELTSALSAGRVRWVILPRRHLTETPILASIVAEEGSLPWESEDRSGNKLVLLEATGSPAAIPGTKP